MEYMIDDARQRGIKELCLDAQLSVIGFYEKLGFVAEGGIFPDAGILHRAMRLRL
jgi:predicted GNAT family N-acyltransferase